ncbi:hypothetical protein pb186bvf_016147 [Paramecium bursaria]
MSISARQNQQKLIQFQQIGNIFYQVYNIRIYENKQFLIII